MTRFILRIFISLLLMVFVAFSVAMVVVRLSIERQLSQLKPPMADLVLASLEEELQTVPPEGRDAQIRDIQERAGMPATILSEDSPDLPTFALQEKPSTGFEDGAFWAALPLPEGGILLLGPERSHVHPTAGDFARILIILLLLIGTFSVLIARPMVRSLSSLSSAADRLGAGDLKARAVIRRPRNPVGQLGRRFNAMADRLEELLDHQRQLVQAVAHEIRTPIARLKFGLEMSEMARTEEERARRLKALHEDLEEMEILAEELLVYVRYESGRAPPSRQRVPIVATLERQVERLVPSPEGVQVHLSPGPEAPLEVEADARAFNRAVGNILSNAMRYARSRVLVDWRTVDGGVELSVSDDGPGIPAADRERVFEPFFRLEPARERARGGAGLGLAITRRVLDAHGGRVRAEDAPGGGARVVTWWPEGERASGSLQRTDADRSPRE